VTENPTYEVARGDVVVQIQFSGQVSPTSEESVFFRRAGHVGEIYVQEGDFVTAGQLLAGLTVVEDLERQQAVDTLRIQRAEEQVHIAELNLALAEVNTSPETQAIEIAIKESQVTLAEIALEEVRLSVAENQARLEGAQLSAPADGQIISIDVSAGDAVEAFEPVMIVADTNEMEIASELRSAELEMLVEGMSVTAVPIGRPGDPINGQIRRVPYQAARDRTVRVSLDDATDLALGAWYEITVVVQYKTGVLWLPPQAIRQFGGRDFVVVLDGEAELRTDVTLGLLTQERVEITSGLSEGQVVIGP
jgi:macrolide-specific efflux system membrane fusion protein